MAKIPFDIKYRPQIESGEYKLETECGHTVSIMDWEWIDRNEKKCLAVKVLMDEGFNIGYLFDYDGKRHSIFPSDSDSDLFIVTPEPDETAFDKIVREAIEYDPETSSEEEIEQAVRLYADDILELAKKEALKDLPRWIELGCVTQVPYAIIKTWHGEYRIGATVEPGDRFIPLGMLEKLPGFKED